MHKNREDLLALLRDGNSDLSCPPALSFRNADGWAERKIVHQDGFDVFAVAASEQTPLSEHFHPRHDQYIWVMSGRMRLTRKDEEHELEAGSAVAIPSKTTHSILPLVESSMMTMYRPPATGEPPDPDVLTPMIPEA